jgi:hypothetical protein
MHRSVVANLIGLCVAGLLVACLVLYVLAAGDGATMNGFQQLAPDVALAAVPYVLNARILARTFCTTAMVTGTE